ncbi:hypothetical protein Agub_g14079, partial [Astrephomene gubernaculifera]
GLLEGCLDLLSRLVRPACPPVVAAVAGGCLGPLLQLLPGGSRAGLDDSRGALAHGAAELLVELLRAGREDLLSWAAPSLLLSPSTPSSSSSPAPATSSSSSSSSSSPEDAVFSALLTATHRLLDPAADEYGTCLAGDLAAALVRHLPSRAAVQPALGGLLAACTAKLAASNVSPLVGGLLAALGLMAVAGGGGGWVEALAGMSVTVPGGAPPVSGLQVVLPRLVERWGEVRGALAGRSCLAGLLEALRSRHPLLGAVRVRGVRQDLAGGVRTRRQAAAAGGEVWSEVPAAVRMVAVAAEMALEQPWAAGGAAAEEEGEEGESEGEAEYEEYEDEEDEEEEGEEGSEEGLLEEEEESGGCGGADRELRLSGRGMDKQQQASLDAHLDRSLQPPTADSALVSNHHQPQQQHDQPHHQQHNPTTTAAASAAAAASDPLHG